MKKPFWMKLITCVLAGMLLVFGVLPTNSVLAGETVDDIESQNDGEIDKENIGEYFYMEVPPVYLGTWCIALTLGQQLVTNYVEDGFIYYEDNGAYKLPEVDSSGKFYLDEDKTYYWASTIPNPNYDKSDPNNQAENIKISLYNDPETVEYYTSESGDKTEIENITADYEDDYASFVESIITNLLLIIGTGFYLVMCFVLEEPFSIEKVIFNKYTDTRLAFFTSDVTAATDNHFISSSGIRDVLNEFFEFFTGIAIVVYLIILVYMGIRIMLGATAERGSRYKELLMYWVEGILLLFLFPYIMKYSIQVNNAFVEFLAENKGQYLIKLEEQSPVPQPQEGDFDNFFSLLDGIIDELKNGNDYMSIMYREAFTKGWLVYAVCWFVMFFQVIGFLVVYFKRVLITMFLIAIFPLVMISYAIDKIGDAKSQAFDNWVKEFMLNVFVQSFHAMTYVLIMSILCMLMDNPSENWLLMLIALSFISKGDNILRAIFSLKGSADSVKGVGATFAKTLAIANFSSTVRGVKGLVTNPEGTGMKLYNAASGLAQKGWNKFDNDVNITALKNKREKMEGDVEPSPMNPNILPIEATKDEIKDDIKDSVEILLGQKEGATDEDVRSAADKLIGYINQTENENVKNALAEVKAELNLSDEQKQRLDNLLKQNASVNALMVGGREVNIKQEIKIILSLLEKDKNGNYTPESMAILNKIAASEDELKAIKLIGKNIKFKKDEKIIEINNQNRVGNNEYFRRRDAENQKRKFKGRGKAKESKESNKDAKSALESMLTENYSARGTAASKKAKRTVRRTSKPGQERANDKIKNNTRQNRVNMSVDGKKRVSKFKTLKKPKKTWQNVDSVTGSEGLKTAQLGAKAKFVKSPKSKNTFIIQSRAEKTRNPVEQRIKEDARREEMNQKQQEAQKNSFTIGGGNSTIKSSLEERGKSGNSKKNNAANIPSGGTTTVRPSGSNVAPGNDIARQQGSVSDLQDRINGETKVEKSLKSPKYSDKDIKNGEKIYKNSFDYDEGYGLTDWVLPHEQRNDMMNLSTSISILLNSENGYYTARELLNNMKFVNQVIDKYKDGTGEIKYALDKIISALDCRPEDYEAYLRVKILNNPDSVGNNRAIIEECKDYVKNTPMFSVIKDRLGYNMDDLREGQNLKYVVSKNTNYDGIVSEQQKARVQAAYEKELERYEIDHEIEKREKDAQELYGKDAFIKEGKKVGIAAIKFGADMTASVGLGIGTGIMSAGASVDGSSETMSQAIEKGIEGYSAANSIYGGSKKKISGLSNTLKDWQSDFQYGDKTVEQQESQKSDNNPIQENVGRRSKPKDYKAKVEDLKDKTEIKGLLFSDEDKNG